MNSDVVSINSKNRNKVVGAYIEAQRRERILDGAAFVAGVLVTLVLPRIIYCVYFGPITAIAFAGLALVGTIVGVAMYYTPPDQIVSCVSKRTTAQLMPTEDTETKKAA